MKYKNNTLNTITYDSQYSSRGITLQSNEEITIPFYNFIKLENYHPKMVDKSELII